MASSSYYARVIKELKKAVSDLSGLGTYFSSCSKSLGTAKKYAKEITINGDTIDQGELENVQTDLDDAETDIDTIISECNTKIDDYQVLYEAALAAEAEEDD